MKAQWLDKDGNLLTETAEGEIKIDDHGIDAPQRVTIRGAGHSVTAGSEVTVTVDVTAQRTPATILEGRQWFVRLAGEDSPQPVDGATGETWMFAAPKAWNGAEITAAVVRGDGAVVYGPSRPWMLEVTGEDPVDPGPETPGGGESPVEGGESPGDGSELPHKAPGGGDVPTGGAPTDHVETSSAEAIKTESGALSQTGAAGGPAAIAGLGALLLLVGGLVVNARRRRGAL